jgi:hypothetical protein
MHLKDTRIYIRLPDDEPSGSKDVEDIRNWNISLHKVHFIDIDVKMQGGKT